MHRLSAFSKGLVIVIIVNLPLHLKVKLVRVNKFLYYKVATYLCYRVSKVVAAVNLLDIYKLTSLVGFTHSYNVNYKVLLFSSAKFNKVVIKQL
jgi:hypothetical protein